MIKLERFIQSDFDKLISWIKNEEQLIQFAGPIFSYPLTKNQLDDYLKMTDKTPLKIILTDTNETIGHCELNYENGNNRLSRILIGKLDARGKGYCKMIISEMTKMIFANPNINIVDLNVYDWNLGAIKCYKKFGFKTDKGKVKTQKVNNEIWKSLNMTLSRENWLQNYI